MTKESKKELEELGEETEGVITTTAKLRDTILAATKVESNEFKGFDIVDDNGKLKDTYQIMLGLSQIYQEIVESDEKLGDNKANLLLETIAGKNRSNIAASILQSPETLEAAYNDSKFNYEGSSEKELNTYLESLESKIQKFKNAVQELANTSIDSGLLGGLIDAGTKLINILDTLIEKIGALPTLLGTFTGLTLGKKGLMNLGFLEKEHTWLDPILGLFKKLASAPSEGTSDSSPSDTIRETTEAAEEAVENISGFKEKITGFKDGIVNIFTNSKNSLVKLGSGIGSIFGKSLTGLSAGLLGATTAVAGLGAAVVVGKIAWDAYQQTFDQVDKRADKVVDDFNKIKSEVDNNNTSIQKLSSRYEELSKGISYSGQNIGLTTEEFKEYQDICNQIANIYPSLVESYDGQGNAILSLKGNIEGLTEAYKEAQKEAYNTLIMADNVDDIVNKFDKTSNTTWQDELFDWGDNDAGGAISYTDAVDELNTFLNLTNNEIRDSYRPIFDTMDSLTEDQKKIQGSGYLTNELGFLGMMATDEELAKAREIAKQKVKEYGAIIEESRSQILTLAEAYLKVDDKFYDEDESVQNMLSMLLNNMSYEDIQKYISGEDKKTTKVEVNNFADSLLNMSEEAKTKLSEAYDLANKFNEDSDVTSYVSQMEQIQSALVKAGVKVPITFLFDDEKEVVETFKNNIQTITGGIDDQEKVLSDYFTKNGIDSISEIEYWNKVTAGVKGATTAIKIYEQELVKAKEKQDKDVREAFSKSTDNKELDTWYNSLSEVDRQIVYEISINEKTSSWILKDWQHEFARVKTGAVEAEEAMSVLFTASGEGDSFYTSTIQPYVDGIMSLKEALTKVRGGNLSTSDMLSLFEKFPELAGKSKDLESAIEDLMNEMDGDISDAFESKIEALGEEAGLTKEQLEALRDMLLNMSGALDLEHEKEVMQNFYTALNESASSTGLSSTSIGNIKDMVAELQRAGKNYDMSGLFEKTANGIHLNSVKLNELQSQYIQLKKEDIQGELDDLTDRYKELSKQLESGNLTEVQKVTTLEELKGLRSQIEQTAILASQYDGLTSAFYRWEQAQQSANEGSKFDSIVGYKDTAKELYEDGRTNTDDFKSYVDLISNKDLSNYDRDGDGIGDGPANGLEAQEVYESLGKTIEGTSYSINDFLEEGAVGVSNLLKATNQLDESWASMDENGNWTVDLTGNRLEQLAEKTGVDVEMLTALLQKANEYGSWDVKFDGFEDAFEGIKTLEELELASSEAKKKLAELGLEPIEINFDVNTEKDIDSEISKIKSAMEIETDPTQLEYLNNALELLITKKVELAQPTFMSIDSSKLSADLVPAFELLKEYQTALNELKVQEELKNQGVDIDTTAATTKVNELASKIQTELINGDKDVALALGFKEGASIEDITKQIENNEISFENVTINKSNIEEQIDTIIGDGKEVGLIINEEKFQSDYGAITLPEKEVNLTISEDIAEKIELIPLPGMTITIVGNEQPLEEKVSEEKAKIDSTTGIMTIDGNSNPAKEKADSMSSYVKGLDPNMDIGANTNPMRTDIAAALDKSYFINVHAKVSGLPTQVDGTAHVSGTAFANGTKHKKGDWTVGGSGGTALVGEEGFEILVFKKANFT